MIGPTLDVIAPDPCHGCGSCCRHMVRPPFYRIGDPAWAVLVAERPDLVAGIDADRLAWPSVDDERACLWLDDAGRCKHYGYRPEVCQDFDPGEPECNAHRAKYGLDPI